MIRLDVYLTLATLEAPQGKGSLGVLVQGPLQVLFELVPLVSGLSLQVTQDPQYLHGHKIPEQEGGFILPDVGHLVHLLVLEGLQDVSLEVGIPHLGELVSQGHCPVLLGVPIQILVPILQLQ